MPAKAAKKKPAAQKAAARGGRPFNAIIILDNGPQFTAAEAELRLRTMALHHTQGAALPPVIRVSSADASPLAVAMKLYRAWRAVGHGSPALYLCATTTPNAALTMLTTDWGNVVLAPNDGTLGLLAKLFAERHIPYTLEPLDLEALIAAERIRMDNPDWEPAPDFALRDFLSPAAAQRLAGHVPTLKNSFPLTPTSLPFAEGSHTFGLKLHEPQAAYAMPTGGNAQGSTFLLNLTLDPLSFDQLLDDRATFVLDMAGVQAPCPITRRLYQPTVLAEAPIPVTLPRGLGHRRAGTLGLDGSLAPGWDERFLTLTLPHAQPSQGNDPVPLTLTRLS